jgi:hypothetical protein
MKLRGVRYQMCINYTLVVCEFCAFIGIALTSCLIRLYEKLSVAMVVIG